jgi:hypothetical protein
VLTTTTWHHTKNHQSASTNHKPSTSLSIVLSEASNPRKIKLRRIAKMSAMFSQNPLMNGPNYSFSDAPKTNNGELREHRFNP